MALSSRGLDTRKFKKVKRHIIIPDQKEYDWLSNYFEKKKDPLYSMVFAYYLLQHFLQIAILKQQGNANYRKLEKLIQEFKRLYPEEQKLIEDIYTWKDKRDVVIHKIFIDHRFVDAHKLDRWLTDSDDLGRGVLLKLRKNLQ